MFLPFLPLELVLINTEGPSSATLGEHRCLVAVQHPSLVSQGNPSLEVEGRSLL